jgi:hypothetical protein
VASEADFEEASMADVAVVASEVGSASVEAAVAVAVLASRAVAVMAEIVATAATAVLTRLPWRQEASVVATVGMAADPATTETAAPTAGVRSRAAVAIEATIAATAAEAILAAAVAATWSPSGLAKIAIGAMATGRGPKPTGMEGGTTSLRRA